MEISVCYVCVDVWFRQHLILHFWLHFSIHSSNDKQFSVNRTLFLLSQDMENIYWCDQVKKTKDRKVVEDGDWTTKRKIYEWMDEWIMHIYSVLLCIAVHLKRFTIMCVCGGGGLSPQPPPVCSIHLDDATAATGQRHQYTHHTPATGGEERVIEPIKWMLSPHTSYRWRGKRVIKCKERKDHMRKRKE